MLLASRAPPPLGIFARTANGLPIGDQVMDRESVRRLQFDRRLQHRRGWLDSGQLEGYVEALPDVTAKMTTIAAAEEEVTAAASSQQALAASGTPSASPASPTPSTPPTHASRVAGDFGTSTSDAAGPAGTAGEDGFGGSSVGGGVGSDGGGSSS